MGWVPVKPGPKQKEREHMNAEKEEGGVGVQVKPGPKNEGEHMRAEKKQGGVRPSKAGTKTKRKST